jgi:hypothetical protein
MTSWRPLSFILSSSMQRLLILACTERKQETTGNLPAIDRYDGPTFRVLRKYLRQSNEPLSIYVLSAEFGLISAKKKIPYYNRRMDERRAVELAPSVVRTYRRVLKRTQWNQIGICLGRGYLSAINGALYHHKRPKLTVVSGGLGKRLTALYGWLNSGSNQRFQRGRDDS